jgi:hypothetical protein
VQAQPLQTDTRFGWKTSTRHWNDGAVWAQGNEPYFGWWNELRYPLGHPQYPASVDLAFDITGDCWQQPDLDYGDAPDSYKTLLASDGARHGLSGIYMGPTIDIEADGQPTPAADGDDLNTSDDEDGVALLTPLVPGGFATISVNSSVAGTFVSAWLDLNGDGDWADAGENVIPVAGPLIAGPNPITFFVPATATAGIKTYARVRLHTNPAGIGYTGYLPYGEVEDYRIPIYKKINKGAAKKEPVGTYVLIEKNVVTANFGSVGWYFEEPDRPGQPVRPGRFAGLGVLPVPGMASPWAVGQTVSACGYTVLNGCELMLQEEASQLETEQLAVATMVQSNRDSGGGIFGNQPGMTNVVNITPVSDVMASGLNTVASLVTLFGRCTFTAYIQQPWGMEINFWIDDGSNLADGGNYILPPSPFARGVKVRAPLGYTGPAIEYGTYSAVTGIMRTYNSPIEGECVRWLWPRDSSDIVPLSPMP